MEAAISSAEQRAARNRENVVAARITDVYNAIPAMTGKLELEYEGELKGADPIARELIRSAVGKVFSKHLGETNFQPVVQWFESGSELKVPETASSSEELAALKRVPGLLEHAGKLGANGSDPALTAAAGEFILEGLWAHKRVSRNEERGFYAERPKPAEPREPQGGRPPRRQYN
jgi:magnesium chelatase subunit I